MNTNKLHSLILAAGKGTRMPSAKPKVLQTLLGDTMLAYVYQSLKTICHENIWTIIGYEAEQVQKELEHISNRTEQRVIIQNALLGTGHALQTALPVLKKAGAEHILIVNGDVPLLDSIVMDNMQEQYFDENADLIFATLTLDDIGQYGRIIRNTQGDVQAIVEAKDFDYEMHGEPSNEINAGIYLISMELAEKLLPKIQSNNAHHEYYITDLIELAISEHKNVIAYNCGNDFNLLGANTPYELMQAEEIMRKKRNTQFMHSGVILHNPEQITIGLNVKIEQGAEIFAPCELYGNTHVSFGTVIHSHCVIKDSFIDKNVLIQSFSHINNASIAQNCTVGPYARLRPKAELKENTHVGNFVEIKNSILGAGSKANHLTYIGDTTVGSNTNIGAGTITCNYDGKNKHRTCIGNDCFIGSNTALVAPVSLGDNVLVGAGSVVTKNAESNTLVVARAKQLTRSKVKQEA